MPAIDKAEVLRYLGHKGQDVSGPLDRLIDDCIAECMKAARPRHISRRFGFMLPPAGGVDLTGTSLTLAGADIRAHLAGGSALVLMAATLGVRVDNLIKRYESADLTRSLILDACATALIESVCDEAEAELRRQAEREGKGLTGRLRRPAPGRAAPLRRRAGHRTAHRPMLQRDQYPHPPQVGHGRHGDSGSAAGQGSVPRFRLRLWDRLWLRPPLFRMPPDRLSLPKGRMNTCR